MPKQDGVQTMQAKRRIKFVAVIGKQKSGKSTIIQSLSGCNNHSSKELITDRSVNSSIYVHAPSPQEDPKTNEVVFSKILDKVLATGGCQGIVIAIQPTLPLRRLRMERMFEIAKKKGLESYAFIIEYPFDKKKSSGRIGNFEVIKKRISRSDPSASVVAIDGRRFASLNSEVIRSIARFPY
jgi:energy-coupling factor transporter ATP-binding protein EcfA2